MGVGNNAGQDGIWLDLQISDGSGVSHRVYLDGRHGSGLSKNSRFGELINYLKTRSKHSSINIQDWHVEEPDFGESVSDMDDSKIDEERQNYENEYGCELSELENNGIEFGRKYGNGEIIGHKLKKFFNRRLIVTMASFKLTVIDGKDVNFQIDVCATQTVRLLKENIEKEQNIEIPTLVKDGNEMEDDANLAQYGIKEPGYTVYGRIIVYVEDVDCEVTTEVAVKQFFIFLFGSFVCLFCLFV